MRPARARHMASRLAWWVTSGAGLASSLANLANYLEQ
jgi:hypothetical protein